MMPADPLSTRPVRRGPAHARDPAFDSYRRLEFTGGAALSDFGSPKVVPARIHLEGPRISGARARVFEFVKAMLRSPRRTGDVSVDSLHV